MSELKDPLDAGRARDYDAAIATGQYEKADPGPRQRAQMANDMVYGAESWQVHRELLRRFLCRPARVLEIGAGSGAYTADLLEMGHDVTATDLSLAQLARNQSEMRRVGVCSRRIDWVQADAVKLPFLDQSFGAVTSVGGVVSHVLRSGPDAVSEAARVLQPGGLAVIGVLGPGYGEYFGYRPASGVINAGADWDFQTYTAQSLSRLMAAWRLQPVHVQAASLSGPARTRFFNRELRELTEADRYRLKMIDERGEQRLYPRKREGMLRQLQLLDDPARRARYIAECEKPANIDKTRSYIIGVGVKLLG